MKRTRFLIVSVVLFLGAALAFSQSAKGGQSAQGTLGVARAGQLVGAGATFPYPLYSKMFDVYGREHGVQVNYQAIGSGGGIQQLESRTVDFGASDAFLTDEQMASFPAPVVHVPIVAGAVTITYNLPGNPGLRLTPDLVADIFLGKFTRWNDGRLQGANPGVNLPNLPISVVHRSDGSGTTAAFSDYLSKVSDPWKTRVGHGTSLSWPVGVGGKGNPGVAGLVKQLPGGVGYVELIYALQNGLPYASIRNRSGNFIEPSLASTTAAADVPLPADMRISLTDTPAPDGYPIASFTYILLYREQGYGGRSKAQAEALVNLVWWMTHAGQQYAVPLEYSPLAPPAIDRAAEIIRSVTWDGRPLVQ